MRAFTMISEDAQMHAHFDSDSNLWMVTHSDGVGGSEDQQSYTDEQMGAILGLAVGGDEQPYSKHLYTIAEPAVEMLSPELRPIP